MSNEADTCRKYILPKLIDAGWDNEPHRFNEQVTFTDGRIVLAGNKVRRRPQKRADYLLRYTRDYLLAVVEAKPEYKCAGDGLQQAKEYAEILGLKFAYATNGREIIEFDYLTGRERLISSFPAPDELWRRIREPRVERTRIFSLSPLAVLVVVVTASGLWDWLSGEPTRIRFHALSSVILIVVAGWHGWTRRSWLTRRRAAASAEPPETQASVGAPAASEPPG